MAQKPSSRTDLNSPKLPGESPKLPGESPKLPGESPMQGANVMTPTATDTKPSKESVASKGATTSTLRTAKSLPAADSKMQLWITKRESKISETAPLRSNTPIAGLPNKEDIDAKTEDVPLLEDEPGKYTDQLSDSVEVVDLATKVTQSKNVFSTMYYRINPLMKNKRARGLATANFIVLILNLILFLIATVIAILAIIYFIKARPILNKDVPCLYEFGEWSECPKNCTENNTTNYKTRKVIPETIVYARGYYHYYAPCPKDVKKLEQKMPCNTHACPKKLSEFEFSDDCWAVDPFDQNKGCYQIRNISKTDQAILIDINTLIQACTCPTQGVFVSTEEIRKLLGDDSSSTTQAPSLATTINSV